MTESTSKSIIMESMENCLCANFTSHVHILFYTKSTVAYVHFIFSHGMAFFCGALLWKLLAKSLSSATRQCAHTQKKTAFNAGAHTPEITFATPWNYTRAFAGCIESYARSND